MSFAGLKFCSKERWVKYHRLRGNYRSEDVVEAPPNHDGILKLNLEQHVLFCFFVVCPKLGGLNWPTMSVCPNDFILCWSSE